MPISKGFTKLKLLKCGDMLTIQAIEGLYATGYRFIVEGGHVTAYIAPQEVSDGRT